MYRANPHRSFLNTAFSASAVKSALLGATALILACAPTIVGDMDRSDENRAITEVVERLAKQFPQVPTDEVEQVVSQSRPEFDDVPIRDFVPLFVERGAKQRLRELV